MARRSKADRRFAAFCMVGMMQKAASITQHRMRMAQSHREREAMKKAGLAVVLGLGLMAGGCTGLRAQAAAQTPEQAPAVTALPEDQQATKEQMAKLFEVMRLRQQLAAMEKMMPGLMQKSAKEQGGDDAEQPCPGGRKPTPEEQAALDKLMDRIMTRSFEMYPADEMIADISSVYRRHINRQDADALIAFYGSSAGQHLLDAQPVIVQEYMPLVMAHMKERSAAFAEETNRGGFRKC